MLLSIIIFVITLVLVIAQPKKLKIGWSALIGAALALACGVVSWHDIPTVWHIVWNATFTFVALVIISLILDESGFFHWAALHVTRLGKNNKKKLFIYTILLGALVSAFFANDGAALILTPIVISILLSLGFDKKTVFAFVMAAGFIADISSLPLIVSNLVNIVTADFFKLNAGHYALVMIPVDLVAIATTLVVLLLIYRKRIKGNFISNSLVRPAEAIKDRNVFYVGWGVLALLLIGVFIAEPLHIPVCAFALPCAFILLITAQLNKKINTVKVLKHAPWQIILFSLGMYLVVYGLRNAGLTHYLSLTLNKLATSGLWGTSLGTGYLMALLSSVMNNLPSVLIGALSIDGSQVSHITKEAMIYANIIGCDLGPKITPIGSLATLLWLHVLSKKDIKVGWGKYFKFGLMVVLPVLFITLSFLAFWLWILS